MLLDEFRTELTKREEAASAACDDDDDDGLLAVPLSFRGHTHQVIVAADGGTDALLAAAAQLFGQSADTLKLSVRGVRLRAGAPLHQWLQAERVLVTESPLSATRRASALTSPRRVPTVDEIYGVSARTEPAAAPPPPLTTETQWRRVMESSSTESQQLEPGEVSPADLWHDTHTPVRRSSSHGDGGTGSLLESDWEDKGELLQELQHTLQRMAEFEKGCSAGVREACSALSHEEQAKQAWLERLEGEVEARREWLKAVESQGELQASVKWDPFGDRLRRLTTEQRSSFESYRRRRLQRMHRSDRLNQRAGRAVQPGDIGEFAPEGEPRLLGLDPVYGVDPRDLRGM